MMNWALRLIAPWLFLAALAALAALGAQAAVAPIVMSVPITPDMAGFVDSLARQPSYAALVLRNAGFPLSFSKPISIDNSSSFRLGNYAVQYLKKVTTYIPMKFGQSPTWAKKWLCLWK